VVSIGGIASGALRGLGSYPFFNGAKESVYAETYEIAKTEKGFMFTQTMPKFGVCPSDPKLSIISCPGTYAYRLVNLGGKAVEINRL